jgi:hypothetical protein
MESELVPGFGLLSLLPPPCPDCNTRTPLISIGDPELCHLPHFWALAGIYIWSHTYDIYVYIRNAGRRIKFARESRLDSPNFFSELLFPNSHSSGLWSGFINPPLQSLFNQCLIQTFDGSFRKRNLEGEAPKVKCSKMPRIWRKNPLKWVSSISRDYCVCFFVFFFCWIKPKEPTPGK